jgi:hypothetical protein
MDGFALAATIEAADFSGCPDVVVVLRRIAGRFSSLP